MHYVSFTQTIPPEYNYSVVLQRNGKHCADDCVFKGLRFLHIETFTGNK